MRVTTIIYIISVTLKDGRLSENTVFNYQVRMVSHSSSYHYVLDFILIEF